MYDGIVYLTTDAYDGETDQLRQDQARLAVAMSKTGLNRYYGWHRAVCIRHLVRIRRYWWRAGTRLW